MSRPGWHVASQPEVRDFQDHGYEFWELDKARLFSELGCKVPYYEKDRYVNVWCSVLTLPCADIAHYEFIRFAHVDPNGQVELMDAPAEPIADFRGKEFSCRAKAIEFLNGEKDWWIQADGL